MTFDLMTILMLFINAYKIQAIQYCPDKVQAFVSCNSTEDCDLYDLDCVQLNGNGGLEPDEKAEKIKEVVTTKSPTIKGAKKSTKRYGYQNQLSVEDVCFDNLGECSRKVQICDRSEYKRLLVKYCPKTCGYCQEALNKHAQYQQNTVYTGNCSDTHQACEARQFMCHVKQYHELMKKNCKFTCRMC